MKNEVSKFCTNRDIIRISFVEYPFFNVRQIGPSSTQIISYKYKEAK